MKHIRRLTEGRSTRRLAAVLVFACVICCAAGIVWRKFFFKLKIEGHFGEDALGFRWEESDSFDARWNHAEIGPFLGSVVATPTGDVAKGLSIKVGQKALGTVCYDLSTMTPRASWRGGFLRFNRRRNGIWFAPEIDGPVHYSDAGPAWGNAAVNYRGLYTHGDRVVLSYAVDGVRIDESPWAMEKNTEYCFYRAFRAAPSQKRLTLSCGDSGVENTIVSDGRGHVIQSPDIASQIHIEPHAQDIDFVIAHHYVPADQDGRRLVNPREDLRISDASPLIQWMKPGPILWPHVLETRGTRAEDNAAYVIDTLTIPFDNPYRALIFPSGFDFFSDGRVAVSALHGDVWILDGVDETLQRLTWKRFATGLHQPLGLRIVDDAVYVLGRDQITRLVDRDQNGEADYYENFNNDGITSSQRHDYVAGLETDAEGNFYYLRSNTGLIRVSADGTRHELMASGFRYPNGLSVGPAGEITVAPQEGEWTPASAVFEVKPGGWYGFGGPRVREDRPLGYDPPLCWIPRQVDNSTGGQVWVTSDRWGPLQGQLISTSYGQCRLLLTLREQVDGVSQGGSAKMGLEFRSGVMRGRFSPQDGQLYVAGLEGWASSSVDDGCLHRVRYTGLPSYLPVGLNVYQNGLLVQFSEPLETASVADVDNFRVEQWNYRYGPQYGSPEYKVSQPNQEGRDELDVQSVSLLPDEKGIFLELADVRPVMQMRVAYTVRAKNGTPVQGEIYNTVNIVPTRTMLPNPIGRRVTDFDLSEAEQANLRSGLIARFTPLGGGTTAADARVSRLAAYRTPPRSFPTPFLDRGPFRLDLDGWLHVAETAAYQFSFQGSTPPRISLDGIVLPWEGHSDRAPAGTVTPVIQLRRGYHKIRLSSDHEAGAGGDWRLYWQTDRFAAEPVPPTALFHDGRDPLLAESSKMRQGREVFATRGCFRCHGIGLRATTDLAMPELKSAGPHLSGIGTRVNPVWLHQWLLDPRARRSDARMPRLFDVDRSPEDVQQVADISAYLGTLVQPATVAKTTQFSNGVAAGLTSEPPRLTARLQDGLGTGTAMATGDPDEGAELFERLGCIACHSMTAPDTSDPYSRLSLYDVNFKYPPRQLVDYLLQPQRHYPQTRMPDFGLNVVEANHLAAFLRARAAAKPSDIAVPTGDVQRGRELFDARGCANCHATLPDDRHAEPLLATVMGAPSLRGCLAADAALRGRAPDFGLTTDEQAALTRFLDTNGRSLSRSCRTEAAARDMTSLQCLRCHNRDGHTAEWTEILAEESEFGWPPERAPVLTWAGEKLRQAWTQSLLAGRLGYRTRPWLQARMPAFPAYAETIAAGLAEQHGVAATEPRAAVDATLAEIGAKLTEKEGGFDCHQCHVEGGKYLDLPNKANGPAFSIITARLRREYYDRWMAGPLRIDPLTSMTPFTEDGVTTKLGTVFNGDARRQFEAIWHYFRSIERLDGGAQ